MRATHHGVRRPDQAVRWPDAALKELAALQQLQFLKLYGCDKVTDAGLKELAALQQFQSLDLAVCKQVTDAGLKELAALKQLQSLKLTDLIQVTDAGLKDSPPSSNSGRSTCPTAGR